MNGTQTQMNPSSLSLSSFYLLSMPLTNTHSHALSLSLPSHLFCNLWVNNMTRWLFPQISFTSPLMRGRKLSARLEIVKVRGASEWMSERQRGRWEEWKCSQEQRCWIEGKESSRNQVCSSSHEAWKKETRRDRIDEKSNFSMVFIQLIVETLDGSAGGTFPSYDLIHDS